MQITLTRTKVTKWKRTEKDPAVNTCLYAALCRYSSCSAPISHAVKFSDLAASSQPIKQVAIKLNAAGALALKMVKQESRMWNGGNGSAAAAAWKGDANQSRPTKQRKMSNIGNKVSRGTTTKEMGMGQNITDLTTSPKNTHVIFAIDFSSSMNKMDVATSNGKISRWEAVFECVDSFLTQQLQQQSGMMSTCLVSVLIFNDASQVILNRTPLVGEGDNIREPLKGTKMERRPTGGTGFSAGFQKVEKLARSHIHDKVILVFLSDGRPGDLWSKPPSNPTTAMQTTFKRSGVVFPAAGHYIECMQKRHGDFSLQLICLFNEGVQWMKYLASRYNGTFHNPDLTLDDAPVGLKSGPPGVKVDSSDDEEDEVVEIMKVKSQATVIREQLLRARTAGEIVSLTNMSTGASSIRSTFSSISATVTAMRSGNKRQERAVIIKPESVMISYQATRMVLTPDASGVDRLTTAPGESPNKRRVDVSMHPFAQGGLRNVYRMKQKLEVHQVAKESRHDIQYNERLKFHLETVKCQAQASLYASYFNKKIANVKEEKEKQPGQPHSLDDVPRIGVLRAEVYRLKASGCPGGFRYLAVEQYLEGNYEKWNNNDGFVNQLDCLKCKVAQAFSHFSYEESGHQKMVVDIQGSGNSNTCVYTDPQLHSVKKEFGRADRGTVGIDTFFASHKCNFICQKIGLSQHVCGQRK